MTDIVRKIFKVLAIYVEQSSTIIAKILNRRRVCAGCRAYEEKDLHGWRSKGPTTRPTSAYRHLQPWPWRCSNRRVSGN